MNYNRQTPHSGKVAHAGHAPPKFRSPTTSAASLSSTNTSTIRRPLPAPPRNQDSTTGLPDSTQQTNNNVTARLRGCEHHMPLKHDVKYTYAINPAAPNMVYFFEYHGYGPPSPTLGALGDVYVDLSQDAHALYGRNAVGGGWTRWVVPGWFEHPFLTDTVLWISPEGIVWTHPMRADKLLRDADIHFAISDMLDREDEARGEQAAKRRAETGESREDADSVAAGNGSRKRPRVEDDSSSELPLYVQQHEKSPASPRADSISQTSHTTPSYHPHSNKKAMSSRITVLQEEMSKLQSDLREIQAENVRVTLRNEKLEEQAELLRGIVRSMGGDAGGEMGFDGGGAGAGGKRKVSDTSPPPPPPPSHTSSSIPSGAANGATNGNTNGKLPSPSVCAKPSVPKTADVIALLQSAPTPTPTPTSNQRATADVDISKVDGLPADVKDRLEGHVSHIATMMNDVVDTHVRLQKAIQTIAEQKRHIVKLFAEIQNQKDARTRLEGEYKEQGEKLQAMNAWLMGVPKFDMDTMRLGA